jgi:hypothetical protein
MNGNGVPVLEHSESETAFEKRSIESSPIVTTLAAPDLAHRRTNVNLVWESGLELLPNGYRQERVSGGVFAVVPPA